MQTGEERGRYIEKVDSNVEKESQVGAIGDRNEDRGPEKDRKRCVESVIKGKSEERERWGKRKV